MWLGVPPRHSPLAIMAIAPTMYTVYMPQRNLLRVHASVCAIDACKPMLVAFHSAEHATKIVSRLWDAEEGGMQVPGVYVQSSSAIRWVVRGQRAAGSCIAWLQADTIPVMCTSDTTIRLQCGLSGWDLAVMEHVSEDIDGSLVCEGTCMQMGVFQPWT